MAPTQSPPILREHTWPVLATEIGALNALSHAGKKMLSWGGRKWRGQLVCEAWEIPTRLPAADFQVDKLLNGAYTTLEHTLCDHPCMVAAVDQYVRGLLHYQRHHTRAGLYAALVDAGCLDTGRDSAHGSA